MPAPSPTATIYRTALSNLKTKLEAERTGGNLWLADAKEVILGLHAEPQRFQATGIYIVPVRASSADEETNRYHDYVRVRIVAVVRSLVADNDQAAPATFTLLNLVGGIVDVLKANRDLGDDLVVEMSESPDQDVAEFETIIGSDNATYYRAEVEVIVRGETA